MECAIAGKAHETSIMGSSIVGHMTGIWMAERGGECSADGAELEAFLGDWRWKCEIEGHVR